MKHLFTRKLMLLVAMLLAGMGSAFAFEYNGLTYRVINNTKKTVKVTYPGANIGDEQYTQSSIVIPQTVDYNNATYTVVEIGDHAFWGAPYLSSVTIPTTVNTVGDNAFNACSNLSSIDLSSVETFGSSVLANCTALTSVTLSESLQSIPSGMFMACTSLASFTFPESTTSIGNSAFQSCTGLTSIAIPESINRIESSAFYGCTNLTSVTTYASEIQSSAFCNCTDLKKVILLSNYSYTGGMYDDIFNGCNNIETIVCFSRHFDGDGKWGFTNDVKETATVYVPESLIENFQNTSEWCEFLSIQAAGISSVGGHVIDVPGGYYYEEIDPNTGMYNSGVKGRIIINGKEADPMYGQAFVVTQGTNVEISFTPNSENAWELETATINGVDVTASLVDGKYTINSISGNQLINATLKQGATYNVFYYANDYSCGSLFVNGKELSMYSNTSKFRADQDINLVIKPNAGYGISYFFINALDNDKKNELTANADGTYSYTYKLNSDANIEIGYAKSWKLTTTYNEGGTVTINGENVASGTTRELAGGMVEVKMMPNSGYELASVLYNGTDVTTSWVSNGMDGMPQIYPSSDQGDNQTLNITFQKINTTYTITYYVDGAIYKEVSYNVGDAVTPEPDPTKDGYTFSGWSTIPPTMPANNVVVTGSFTKNGGDDEPANSGLSNKDVSSSYAQHNNVYGTDYVYFPGNTTAFDGYMICGVEQTKIYWSGYKYHTTFNYSLIPNEKANLIKFVYSNTKYDVGSTISGEKILARSSAFNLPYTPSSSSINQQTEVGYYFKSDGTIVTVTHFTSSSSFNEWDVIANCPADAYCYCYAVATTSNIIFADANVKAILLSQTKIDTNGDGEISYEEAAAITNLGNIFKRQMIVSFDELQYFTGLTSIDYEAFSGCTNLTSITIPNSVTTIGLGAFYECYSLRLVTSKILIPFDVNAFDWSCANFTLVVPEGSRSAYKSVSGWTYGLIIEEGETNYAINKTDDQGVRYSLRQADDNSFYYAVTGHTDALKSEIVIPADIDGCPVKTIECYNAIGAFNDCNNLTSVKIGKNVRSIGDFAFSGCTSLISITLPQGLESIGGNAFGSITWDSYCPITSITIPSSVKTIGSGAFQGCRDLASVSLEEGLISIGDYAFRECSFTSITIPNSVTTIGSGAFANNYKLTTAILGDGITEIANNMFNDCGSLASITIPEGVTRIGYDAFSRCGLRSIKLPGSLTSMDQHVFSGCQLKSIELPNSLTEIPANLFEDNDLDYIKLGNNVKSIGENAFGSRLDMEESIVLIEIGTSTPPTIAKDAFPNLEALSVINVIVPDAAAEKAYRNASVWKDMTFTNQSNVSEVTVDTPGDLDYELITECNMQPAKVVSLKVKGTINAKDFDQMRTNMKSLLRLDLSECDITEIPDGALQDKIQLQELILPTKLQTIGNYAFAGCSSLTGKLSLPSGVTSIGDNAFEGTYYTSVALPSKLKNIGSYAFYNLPIKQKIILPDALTSIGDYAFAETRISGHAELPEGIKNLGAGAFRNTHIDYVSPPDNPKGLTSISRELFQGCTNLDYVYIPRNFTEISGYAFDGCTNLSYVRLSPNLETLGEYAFQNTELEYIKIPSKVKNLSEGVFRNCKNLESLSLPADIETVGRDALRGCNALRNLSVEAIEPPTVGASALIGINTDLCLISIPTQSYKQYVTANYWGQFVQMRNDIAVETEGNGEIGFESVIEGEDEVLAARKRAQRAAAARGITRASEEEDDPKMTLANNGSSIYVPKDGLVRFIIIPGEGEELLSATLDGEDITPYIVDDVYIATADKKTAKLVVKFSGESRVEIGDANSDKNVDARDVKAITDYMIGNGPEKFSTKAADMNNDTLYNIADIIQIVNQILSKE